METALNIAGTLFFLAFLGGVVMLGLLIWVMVGHSRSHVAAPVMRQLPTLAVDEMRHAVEQLKSRYYRAVGMERDRVGLELRRLEARIVHLERTTQDDQFTYYELGRRLNRAWIRWKTLREEGGADPGMTPAARRHALRQAERDCAELRRLVAEEYHRAVGRDLLALEELRSQGVLMTSAASAPEPALDEALPAEQAPPAEEPPQATPPPETLPAPPVPVPAAPAFPEPTPETSPAQAEQERSPEPPVAPPPATPEDSEAGEELSSPAEPPPPFELETAGELHQADFAFPDVPKGGRRYADATFQLPPESAGVAREWDLSRVSFLGARFTGVHDYKGCAFVGSDLRRIEMKQEERPHRFTRCNFSGATFAQARIGYTVLMDCDLSDTNWSGAVLDKVRFIGCDLTGVSWEGIDLDRTVMSQDMLAAGDFSEAGHPPRSDAVPAPRRNPQRRPGAGIPAPADPPAAEPQSPQSGNEAPAHPDLPKGGNEAPTHPDDAEGAPEAPAHPDDPKGGTAP